MVDEVVVVDFGLEEDIQVIVRGGDLIEGVFEEDSLALGVGPEEFFEVAELLLECTDALLVIVFDPDELLGVSSDLLVCIFELLLEGLVFVLEGLVGCLKFLNFVFLRRD